MAQQDKSGLPSIIFNISKKEQGNPNTSYKKLIKRYKKDFRFGLNKEEITIKKLQTANLIIFAASRELFSQNELEALKSYLESGGNILVCSTEGGEMKSHTNLNYLLEQFGISINADGVVRTAFNTKYLHPKEAYIQQGAMHKEIVRIIEGKPKEMQNRQEQAQFFSSILHEEDDLEKPMEGLSYSLFNCFLEQFDYLYPFGATLNVQTPAFSLFGTGPLGYPLNRPTIAYYERRVQLQFYIFLQGKLIVCGSYEMFADNYLEKEENIKIFEFFLTTFFSQQSIENDSTREQSEKAQDYHFVPEISEISEKLKSCLQESEDLPTDFLTLFNHQLFKFDTDLIPDALKLFNMLDIKHEPISLIPPEFETPLLGLQPAVIPPILRELPPPNLELFDLESEFAQERVKLAQITNKCKNTELNYFVRECGDILGISEKVGERRNNPKAIMRFVLESIINFKKLNQ